MSISAIRRVLAGQWGFRNGEPPRAPEVALKANVRISDITSQATRGVIRERYGYFTIFLPGKFVSVSLPLIA